MPIFLVYLMLCISVPLIRFGKTRSGKGVKFWIVKDPIHSDYLFESKLWEDVFRPKGKYIKIGWGDRKIFLETKEWKDLTAANFLKAFCGLNSTVLRVDFTDEPPDEGMEMDRRQFEAIVSHIAKSHNGNLIEKRPEYYQRGDFYESDLDYNCIKTCNDWVNRGLVKAQISNKIWCPLSFWL